VSTSSPAVESDQAVTVGESRDRGLELFELSLESLNAERLEAAARYYGGNGFLVLTDVESTFGARFEERLAGVLAEVGLDAREVIEGRVPLTAFSGEARERVSRIDTTPELAGWMLGVLEPLLLRLLGPILQVSSNFHAQFKGGDLVAPAVDHGGYPTGTQYLEPFGQYLLHQDFTGAKLPTSPSFVTLWVPLTTGPNWGLRLYPGSHRLGILCNDWIPLEDARLEMLGTPVDFAPQRGKALVFNAMLLHSSVHPGPSRRVSCDVRFFPLCGFLPTVPWILGDDPERDLRVLPGDNEILRMPRLEAQILLGRESDLEEVPEHSPLNWAKYVEAVRRGDLEGALPYLERFTNPALTGETWDVYRDKYHGQAISRTTLERAQRALAEPAGQPHPRSAS
jgi:Phytanoyl-CoA dioxygenase (PhyH)